MVSLGAISLMVDDPSVLASLEFSLSIEGFEVSRFKVSDLSLPSGGALVVDESYLGDGILSVASLRERGWNAPAIILSTNPTPRLRERVSTVHALLIEKPLLGDELSCAIRKALKSEGN